MRKQLLTLLISLFLLGCTAAQADTLPPDLIQFCQIYSFSGSNYQDYLEFHLPDGNQYGFILHEGGYSISGFKKEAGAWQMQSSGQSIGDYDPGFLRRHDTKTPRPDGSLYPDDLGFDFVSSRSGATDSYHYDGQYFSISGWFHPAYEGHVMVKGLSLEYYPLGSAVPEFTITAGDEETLSNWLFERPLTPDDAKQYASFQKSAIAGRYPGYTLYSYSVSSIGRLLADTLYMKIENGMLYIKAVGFDPEAAPAERDLIPVPLSKDVLALGEEQIIAHFQQNGEWFLAQLSPMPFDREILSLKGNLIDFDIQQNCLIILTEEDSGRYLSVITRDEQGNYLTKTTGTLPQTTYLDTFHAGDGDIQLEWDQQRRQAGYTLSSKGDWQLSWVMSSDENGSFDYSVSFYQVRLNDEQRFIGSLRGLNLWDTDLEALPKNEKELKAALDRTGWAVVHNPDPADRLHLREKADKSSASLGKFYNGTPVQVLKKQGDWYQVRIGQSALTGWMMKKYLAEGEKMDAVRPAFPDLVPKDAYYDHPDLPDISYDLIGIYQETQFILLNQDGEISLAPMNWFFPGNG
ncbi:MAG: SH3 domain-containing protein [Clostridiales bacterium]|nr:SH3 domain-containing protein [Clostridiales bacterium]